MCVFSRSLCVRVLQLLSSLRGAASLLGTSAFCCCQGFLFQGMEGNAQVAQEWDGVWKQNEEPSGKRSPFCAKSLSAIRGPHVQSDCLPA